MKPYSFHAVVTMCLFVLVAGQKAGAQQTEAELTRMILQKDSLFWDSYNRCDTSNYDRYFSPDVEFYHDKGGITNGVTNLALSVKNNLCSNPDFRIKREVVKGTTQVYPLTNSGKLYGAILSGEHVFYILEKAKPARLDGRANFTHLWLLKDGSWKMTRILSYNHHAAQ